MNILPVPQSLSADPELDAIWIDSMYFSFKWNFETLGIHDGFISKWKKIKDIGIFSLEVRKISLTEFVVALNRKHENCRKPPDAGYYLECSISVLGCDKPRDVDLSYGMYRVTSIFQYNEIDKTRGNVKICTAKCLIKMCEINVLENEASRTQNELIENLKAQERYRESIEDMAFILNRKSLEKIFTGRQNYEFALSKAGFIERSLPFAVEIANKVYAKLMEDGYEPQISPELYLGCISGKGVERINKLEVLDLYLSANKYGLPYLVDECRDFMLLNIDVEYLVYILLVSEITSDSELASKALRIFTGFSDIILKTYAWETLIKKAYPIFQCILDTLRQTFKPEANLQFVRREKMLIEELRLREYVKRRVFGEKQQASKVNRKRKLTTNFPQAGKYTENVRQYLGEKRNTDKNAELCSTEASHGATEEANMQSMGEEYSNLEQYADESASLSERAQMEPLSAYGQHAMHSSFADQYNIGFFPGAIDEDANMEPVLEDRFPITPEDSNTEQYSVEDEHSASGHHTVGGDSFTEQYSIDESDTTSAEEDSMEEISTNEEDIKVDTSTDQSSTEESDTAGAENLEESSDERNRPEKHSMEEQSIT